MRGFVPCLLLIPFAALGDGAGDVDPARLVERYRQEVVADPRSVGARTQLGGAYLWLASYSGDLHHVVMAESVAYHALEIDSSCVPALNVMSCVLMAEHRFEDVMSVQNWSIKCDGSNPESWAILTGALMDMGRYRTAKSCLAELQALEPAGRSLLAKARWEFDVGDADSALLWMSEAIDAAERKRPPQGETTTWQSARDLSSAYVSQGVMLLSRGRWEDAQESAEKSLSVAPGFVPALALKADVLRLEGRYDESLRICKDLAARSKDPALASSLAKAYADEGRGVGALAWVARAKFGYEERLAEHPEATRSEYATFLIDWGIDRERALALAVEESKLRRDVYTYDLLAWAYYANGRYDFAWSSIALALRSGARHSRILYHAAAIAKARGDREKLAAYLEKLRRSNPRCGRQYGSL